MYFFPLENRNVPISLAFETQKSGQFRLNRDGWQVVCCGCWFTLVLTVFVDNRRILIHVVPTVPSVVHLTATLANDHSRHTTVPC